MRAIAGRSSTAKPSQHGARAAPPRSRRELSLRATHHDPAGGAVHAKPGCACGGGCPRCTRTAPAVRGALNSSGQALDPASRSLFEPRFGRDFSDVRVHAGAQAAASARALNARAYNAGNDIVFDAGQYRPDTSAGKRLLAHELAHVAQQTPSSMHASPQALAVAPARDSGEAEADRAADAVIRGEAVALATRAPAIRRSPRDEGGSAALHEDLIEEYRAAHGLPPHGIDPSTGQQVGPTDSEIRFGELDSWVRGKAGVAAPDKAPKLAGVGTTDIKTDCHKDHPKDEDAYHACRRHWDFVTNLLPAAVDNIRAVKSPYSAAIWKLYESTLKIAKYTIEPRINGPTKYGPAFPGKLSFGGTSRTLNSFSIGFHQRASEETAKTTNIGGGSFAIEFNETDDDVALQNLPAIESAMVHEAMHLFSAVVEEDNTAARKAGTAVVDTNLDEASYEGKLKAKLESAVLPFVTGILALPSVQGAGSAQLHASLTASTLISESFAFTEAGVYDKQRAGKQFASADLGGLLPFYTFPSYWSPQPTVRQELIDFLVANKASIEKAVKPVIQEIGEKYLSLRPS
jgi:Domain of unknown function (DUF4157)